MFSAVLFLTYGAACIGVAWFLHMRRRPGPVFFLFFAVFCLYLFFVFDFTVFQYQSLLLMKYLTPGLLLQGQQPGKELNLVPLWNLTEADAKTSVLNVLLLVPFGFGLPFLRRWSAGRVILAGGLLSLGIEVVQYASGRLAGLTFRIADVNDLLFNTVGAALGYLAFLGFHRGFRGAFGHREIRNPVLRYIADRGPHRSVSVERSEST